MGKVDKLALAQLAQLQAALDQVARDQVVLGKGSQEYLERLRRPIAGGNRNSLMRSRGGAPSENRKRDFFGTTGCE
jgi:hypothetical protein